MNYCKKCGAYVPDWASECPACGYSVRPQQNAAGAAAAQQAPPKQNNGRPAAGGGEEPRREASDAKNTRRSSSYDERMRKDAETNKGLGSLCYFGPLFLLSLALRPESPFVRYHANQGLLLMLLTLAVSFCFDIFLIGWLAGLIGAGLGFIGFIKGVFSAASGKCEPLPLIGGITIIKQK